MSITEVRTAMAAVPRYTPPTLKIKLPARHITGIDRYGPLRTN